MYVINTASAFQETWKAAVLPLGSIGGDGMSQVMSVLRAMVYMEGGELISNMRRTIRLISHVISARFSAKKILYYCFLSCWLIATRLRPPISNRKNPR
jgi:hypothetical protein